MLGFRPSMDTHSKADAAAPALAHVLVGTLEIVDVRQLFDRCASSKFTGLLELHEGARKVTVGFVGGEALEGIEPLKLGAVWRKGSWQLSQRALDLSGGLADGVEVQGSLGDASPMDLLELCEDGRLSAEIVFTGGDAGKSATVRFAKGRMEGAELNGKPDMAALATVGGWKGGRFRLTVRPQFAPPESSLNADAPSGAIALPPAAPSPTSGPPRPPIVPALPVAPPAATVAAAPPSPAEDSTGGWDADEDATRESPAAPMAVASPAGVPTVEGTAPTIPAAATPTIAATATATSPSAIASSAASTGLARPSLGATGGVRPSLLGAKPLPSRDAKPGAPVPSLLKVTIGAGKPALAGDAAAGGSAAGPLAGAPSAIKATPAAGVAAPPSAPTSSPAAPSLFARAAGSALKPASTPGAPAGGASLFARAGGAGGPPSAPGSASTKPAMPSLLGRPLLKGQWLS